MKKIAMKCSQKDWDSIKDKLDQEKIVSITSFDNEPYLVNDFNYDGEIANITKPTKKKVKKNYEIHETFNAKIFLEACGIEFDEYEITKETVLKYQMKDEFPEVINEQEAFFNKPILSLNDLLSVWGFKSEIEIYKTAPLFKKFENLAKSKL